MIKTIIIFIFTLFITTSAFSGGDKTINTFNDEIKFLKPMPPKDAIFCEVSNPYCESETINFDVINNNDTINIELFKPITPKEATFDFDCNTIFCE